LRTIPADAIDKVEVSLPTICQIMMCRRWRGGILNIVLKRKNNGLNGVLSQT
jgi:hypothetical protein